MINNEIWKEIEGYNGVYFVSNIGRVKSTDRTIKIYKRGGYTQMYSFKATMLKPRANKNGYLYIGLWKDGIMETAYIHRLVTKAFIGPIPSGMQVNHKDRNKRNNCVENLEIVSPAENTKHAYHVGENKRREYNELHSKKIAIISSKNKIEKVFDSVGDCADYIKKENNLDAQKKTIRRNISTGARLGRIRYNHYYRFI